MNAEFHKDMENLVYFTFVFVLRRVVCDVVRLYMWVGLLLLFKFLLEKVIDQSLSFHGAEGKFNLSAALSATSCP
jgi:hypothetical protein